MLNWILISVLLVSVYSTHAWIKVFPFTEHKFQWFLQGYLHQELLHDINASRYYQLWWKAVACETTEDCWSHSSRYLVHNLLHPIVDHHHRRCVENALHCRCRRSSYFQQNLVVVWQRRQNFYWSKDNYTRAYYLLHQGLLQKFRCAGVDCCHTWD